jgi:hypothetical protein
MFGSAVLEVTIGLILIYFVYSLLATTVNEIIASIFNLRAKKLKLAITRMLVDDNTNDAKLSKKLLDTFYNQPLIKYMSVNGKREPSFITAGNFSKALIGSIRELGAIKENFSPAALSATLAELKKPTGPNTIPSETFELLESFLNDANNDLEKYRQYLEKWFDDTMGRATGWYKRQTQKIIFGIGLVVAVGFNIDTIEIVKTLSQDKNAREQMVALAKSYLDTKPAFSSSDSTELDSLFIQIKKQVNGEIQQTNTIMGLGWESPKNAGKPPQALKDAKESPFYNPLAWIGWLLTMFAISLGAPFWFDLLSKFMSIRGTGVKPSESTPTATTEIPIADRKN